MPRTRASIRLAAGLLSLILTLAFVESAARLFLWKQPPGWMPRDSGAFRLSDAQRQVIMKMLNKTVSYYDFDPAAGWTIVPNGVAPGASANAAGFRANHEYGRVPADGVFRISAYGDSFTHCDEVDNFGTWEYQLEQKVDGVEVLNFGVAGYAPDQALLRYRRYRDHYKSDVVLIGVLPENINRVVNIFRPFYQPHTNVPLTKPRFVMTDSGLRLIENPIKTREEYRKLLESPEQFWSPFARSDFWYRHRIASSPLGSLATIKIAQKVADQHREQLYEDPEAIRLLFAILWQFHQEVEADGARPVIVIFTERSGLSYFQNGRRRHQPLLDLLDRHRLEYVDLLEAFRQSWRSVAATRDHPHHTREENELIAAFLAHLFSDRTAG
jgi:hypothetical protein